MYGAAASEPASFTLEVNTSTVPTLTWTALSGVGGYTVRLSDRACSIAPVCWPRRRPQPAFWAKPAPRLSIVYPCASFAAVPLQLGQTYVAVLTAQRADGSFLGFASREFRPSAQPTAVGGGIAAPAGSLLVTTAAGTLTFTPAALGQLQSSAPSCSGSGALFSCVSGLTLTWGEPLPNAVGTRGLAVTLNSINSVAPGLQPSVDVTDVFAHFAQSTAPATQYSRACGALFAPRGCGSGAALGITLDSTARTLSFNNTSLPAVAPATGNLVLNGNLRY